jgi:membrane fusion protein, multidrug efflux system
MTYPINTTFMKPNTVIRLSIVVLAAFLASCSATTSENEKQGRLEKLKKQQTELAAEIKSLEEQIAKENPTAKKEVKPKDVSVTILKAKSFDHYVQTQGLIEAENNILVSAKTPGVIEHVFVKEGQQVSKGQVIAQIDNSIIQSQISSMQSQLELANTVYERQKNLWAQKIGTEVQYLQAKTNRDNLEKQLSALQEQNDMTRIKSPISGSVDEVNVKVGENIMPGQPAARVVNGADLKLKAKVSEAYVVDVKLGNKVLIDVPEIRKEIVGKVSFVGRNIDPLSRTFTVEVDLASQSDLRPNMTAVVKVVFKNEPQALVVPVNVIQTLNNEKIVYIAEKNGNQMIARKKVVKVEGVYNKEAQVQGLSDGDQIVTFGYQGLNDGQPIKI